MCSPNIVVLYSSIVPKSLGARESELPLYGAHFEHIGANITPGSKVLYTAFSFKAQKCQLSVFYFWCHGFLTIVKTTATIVMHQPYQVQHSSICLKSVHSIFIAHIK